LPHAGYQERLPRRPQQLSNAAPAQSSGCGNTLFAFADFAKWSAGRRQRLARPLQVSLAIGRLRTPRTSRAVSPRVSSGCQDGFARPIPGRARLMRRGCEARHRDAAPPGAPPPIRRMNRADQHRCRKRHWHFTQRTRRPTFVLSDSAPIVGLFQEHLEGADIGLYRTPSPKLLRTRTRCASMWRSL
jgi:hypothetical protein